MTAPIATLTAEGLFTPEQLASFADKATKRAERKAAKMWPPGHDREVTFRNLQQRYYAEYATPAKPTIATLTARLAEAEELARYWKGRHEALLGDAWISVKDALPEYGVPVLVGWDRAPWLTKPTPFVFPHGVCRDDAGDDHWAWFKWEGEPFPVGDDCEWEPDAAPTHWQHMPAPPTDPTTAAREGREG